MNTNDFQLQNPFARIVEDPKRPALASFDPNDARSLTTEHVFRLTFQAWAYSIVIETGVGGNCQGFDNNLDMAIFNLYEALPENHYGNPFLVLYDEDGGSMEVDENARGEYPLDEDALKTMLVRAEIIALAPKEDKAA